MSISIFCQAAEHSYFLVAGGDVTKMRNQSITIVPYMQLHRPRLHRDFESVSAC